MAYYGGGPHYYPPGRSPSPSRPYYPDEYMPTSKRPPSPTRAPPRSSNYGRGYNTRRVDPYDYGPEKITQRYTDYDEFGYGYGPPLNPLRRKCCTVFIALLILLLLAGLAVGLYFLITKLKTSSASNAPSKVVKSKGYSGYYVNGVYVVPVTSKPQDVYIIYGTDTPCHKFNNVTESTPVYPNCNQLSTKIALATMWTTPKPIRLVAPALAASTRSLPLSITVWSVLWIGAVVVHVVLDRGGSRLVKW